jgi:tetratricopeptide (TPR) repeat protein
MMAGSRSGFTWTSGLLCVAVALLLTGCVNPRVESPIDLARRHFAQGDVESGFSTLEQALQREGTLEMGNFYRQRIVEHQQEDRAISFFKKLTESGNVGNDAYYNFAFAYIDKIPRVGPMGAGFLSKRSIAQFKIVQEKQPEDWIANYGIGMNYLHWPDYFKKTEGALGYFEKCMQIQAGKPVRPQYLLTYLRMGDALVRGGEIDRAYQTWQEGLEKFPEHPDLLDRIRMPRDQIDDAIRNLYNPNNSIGAIDTNIEILWASQVPEKAVPLQRNALKQAGVGGQLRGSENGPEQSQVGLFSWFTRNLPLLSDRNTIARVDMSALGVERGSGLQSRVNSIAYGMITGFMAEMEGDPAAELRTKAAAVDSFTRPFFHEGLGMGYAASVSIDDVRELRTMSEAMNSIDPKFQRLHLAGAGMWFGLESADNAGRIAEAFRQLGPFGEAYAYEGYGFARTLFYYKNDAQVLELQGQLRPAAAANYYHGVGRAFWILSGADPNAAEANLQRIPSAYVEDAYSGYGMGMAFTQVDDVAAVFRRVKEGESHQAQLLTGITMGLFIRRLGDPGYVDALLHKAASADQCRAQRLLAVGAAALEDATRGGGDLHANWRAAIQARINAASGSEVALASCA